MSKVFISDGKAIVADDGHWITINGNHVLINEKGEVQSGLGGKLNGVKLKKFAGKPSGAQLRKNYENANEEYEKKHNERSKKREDYYAKKGLAEIQAKIKDPSTPKSELAKLKAKEYRIKKEADKLVEQDNKEVESLWHKKNNLEKASTPERKVGKYNFSNSEYKGPKNLVHRNLSAEKKKLVSTAEKRDTGFRRRIEELRQKQRNIEEKYNKAAKRVKKSGIGGEGMWNNFANKVEQRGYEKSHPYKQEETNLEARQAQNWRDAANKISNVTEKMKPAQRTLSNARAKLKSAREANAAVAKMKGTKVSKATSKMVGGKFNNLHKEQERIANNAHSELRKLPNNTSPETMQKQNNIFNRYENAIRKSVTKENAAKQTLAKARPKIAERRQAKANYIRNEISKVAEERGAEYRKLKNATGDEEKAIVNRIGKLDKKLASLSKA